MPKAIPVEDDFDVNDYYRYRFIINPERMCLFDDAHNNVEWSFELREFWEAKAVVIPFHKVFMKVRGIIETDWSRLDIFQKQEMLLQQKKYVPNPYTVHTFDGVDFYPDWIEMGRDYTLRPLREATDWLFFPRFFSFSIDRRVPIEISHFLNVMLTEHFESNYNEFRMFLLTIQKDDGIVISDDYKQLIREWVLLNSKTQPLNGKKRNDLMLEGLFLYYCEKSGAIDLGRRKMKWLYEHAASACVGKEALYKKLKSYRNNEFIRKRDIRKCYDALSKKLDEYPVAKEILNHDRDAIGYLD